MPSISFIHPLVWLIARYQSVSCHLPGFCRFTPSCSEYAKQAILKHGSSRGLALAGWRILRCNPFSAGGHEPVPD